MTYEQDMMAEGVVRASRKGTLDSFRRPYIRSRRAEAQVDFAQLFVGNRGDLRIRAAGGGAGAPDVGKFWFVPGYSIADGGDIVLL